MGSVDRGLDGAISDCFVRWAKVWTTAQELRRSAIGVETATHSRPPLIRVQSWPVTEKLRNESSASR
jgi:hypothetical protein